jgi:hypothetical protein
VTWKVGSDVLDAQTQDFSSRERFLHAVLGLLSVTERVQALAPSSAPTSLGHAASGSEKPGVGDFLLGLVSVGRTLRATLELATDAPPASAPPAPPPPPERILR